MSLNKSSQQMRKSLTSKNMKDGFSLLELLLVITISAVIGTIVVQIFDDFAKRNANAIAANHILRIHNATEEFVTANFTTVLGAIPNNGDIDEITVADLAAENFLPAAFDAQNNFGQVVTSFVRNQTGATGEDIIEVVSVSTGRAYPNDRIIDAALAGGAKAGVIIDLDTGANCCDGNIQSFYNEWSVDLAPFSTAGADDPDADAGYLAAYGRVSFSTTFNEDLLYRVEITGRPDLNQMRTNLYMNNNNVDNTGVLTADSINVGYDYNEASASYSAVAGSSVNIDGAQAGTGNFTPFAMTIDQAVDVSGNAQMNYRVVNLAGGANCTVAADGTITDLNGGDPAIVCGIQGGEMMISGDDGAATDLNVGTLDIVSNANSGGLLSAAENMTVNGTVDGKDGAEFVANFNDVDTSGNVTAAEFNAFDFNVGQIAGRPANFNMNDFQANVMNMGNNDVQAQNLIAGQATLDGGEISTPSTAGDPNIYIEGQLTTRGTLSAQTIDAGENVFIGNTTGCNAANGCPAF